MKVRKSHIEQARRVQKLADTHIRVKGTERWIAVDLLPFNVAGQTTREVCSFTYAIAHMITTTGGPMVTGITEEAAWYVDDHACAEYERRVRDALTLAGLVVEGVNDQEDAAA